MNKRIFLTVAAVLVIGTVLYKMPSRAAEEQVTQDVTQQVTTIPTMDEQSVIREKVKNLARPEINIDAEDLITATSDGVNIINYLAPKLNLPPWSVTRLEFYRVLDSQKFKLYTILLDEDTRYLKEKVKMLEDKIRTLETAIRSKE